MAEDIWDAFPEAVEFTQSKRPMKRPSEKDLDACEQALGVKLPRSYRTFVKRFGAGTLRHHGCPGEWHLWAPGNPKNRFNSSLELHNQSRGDVADETWFRHFQDPLRAARLVTFADSPLSLEGYGWDPEDVTDPDGPEYGVYSWNCKPLDAEPVPRVAVSFPDFIMGYCLVRYPKEEGYTRTARWKKFGSMRVYHRD